MVVIVTSDYSCYQSLLCDIVISGAHLTLKHRRVKHYGYEFMYGINNVDPDRPLEQGIPHECDQFLDRLMAVGCLKQRPDQLTVNQYKPGQGG